MSAAQESAKKKFSASLKKPVEDAYQVAMVQFGEFDAREKRYPLTIDCSVLEDFEGDRWIFLGKDFKTVKPNKN